MSIIIYYNWEYRDTYSVAYSRNRKKYVVCKGGQAVHFPKVEKTFSTEEEALQLVNTLNNV